MLQATVFNHGTDSRTITDLDEISDLVEQEGCLTWLDALDPGEDELKLIEDEFSLHPLAIEDIRHTGQRPKIDPYGDHAFLVAYASSGDPNVLTEVAMFISKRWLITVRHSEPEGAVLEVEGIKARFERTRGGKATVGFLLYVILDTIVDSYFDALDASEDVLESVEEHIFEVGRGSERDLQQALLRLRRELLMFRRRVVPLRDVMQVILRQEVAPIGEDGLRYFQDVLDHLLRTIDTLETQRELLGNAVDAHLAVVNNKMNEIMKKMTSWGAILFGAALISGIYGMNFTNMPELGWRFGYYGALALMATMTGSLYLWFKHKGWL